MIKFVYGAYGSGKTSYVLEMLKRDAESGIHSFLLVPDQEALQLERLTLSALPASSQINLEILGFSRLYNRVCREYGGLSYSYATKPMKALLMWKCLRELNGLFEDHSASTRRASDTVFVDTMISTVNELKANGVTAAELELAADKLPQDAPLRARLRDTSLIYACYDNLISEKYSDSADDLARLRDLLYKTRFFKGCNVYIDSFTSYTAVQHRIIEQIFKDADNVNVTIPMSSPDCNDISLGGIAISHKKLLLSSEACGGHKTVLLGSNKRATSPALAYLSENLWCMDADPSAAPELDGSIVCEICDNPYAEAEAVAAHIIQLLRNGARCRDIVVIARDCESYRGILDTALEKSEIPFFFTQKTELCSIPAVKLLLSALRIKKYNWQKADVIAHLKTGLCDVDGREANLFEEYVSTWNIHGDTFLADVWNMNPDGFVAELSPRGREILTAANSVRKKLVEPLMRLFIQLDACDDLAAACRVIYSYLEEINLESKLSELAQKAALRGDLKQAGELSRIYGIMLNTLADIGEILGDEEADVEELAILLKSIFDKTEIGSIPTSVDEVTVGSASLLRAPRAKYAFVIGLCEGEFPASVKDNGFFSSNDRDTLSSLGIELSGNTEVRSSDELMYVHRAFSAPSEKLFAFTSKSKLDGTSRFPSLAFTRIEKLFGGRMIPHRYKLSDIEYLTPAPRNAVGILRSLDDGIRKEALRESLNSVIPEFSLLSATSTVADKCAVSPDAVSTALGDSLRLSSTSFEKYVKCPFSYFCSNVLRLREEKNSKFNANDMGSFVHYVLEVLLKHAIPDSADKAPPSDEELAVMASEAIKPYLESICPPSLLESKRLNHLYKRLRSLALLLVKNAVHEFSASEFRPMFYELRANGKDGNPSPLVFTLDDGCRVSFTGVVDRVDVYKNNGNVYIRVVDYKTGSKSFSLSDIEHGINLQMLIYLFTICRSRSAEFKAALGIDEGGSALPAGVIYLSANIPTVEADDYESAEAVEKSAENELSRSGLLLNDKDVLIAMNNRLDSNFLAGIKQDGSGNPTGTALTSEEDFASIFEKLQSTVKKIAGELHAGKADANPLLYNRENPCDYCKSKSICRRSRG